MEPLQEKHVMEEETQGEALHKCALRVYLYESLTFLFTEKRNRTYPSHEELESSTVKTNFIYFLFLPKK